MPPSRLLDAERVTAAEAHHGEGPLWDGAHARLLWLDMLAGDVLSTDPVSGATERLPGPEDVAALVRATHDGYVLVGRTGIWLGNLRTWNRMAVLPLGPGERANDGGCTDSGLLLVGSMSESERPGGGAVHAFDGRVVRTALPGTTISNGMVFDGDACWFVDSPTREVRRYTVSPDGGMHATGDALPTPPDLGVPDGLCADADGGLWVAMWDGGCVLRLTADGAVDATVRLPVPRPTSCCFGGPDGRDLYITTSRYGQDDPPASAGALFRCRTAHRGAPVARFVPRPPAGPGEEGL
jgi:sugar lactone lactonase YvrE